MDRNWKFLILILLVLFPSEAWMSLGFARYGNTLSKDHLVAVVVGMTLVTDFGPEQNKKIEKEFAEERKSNIAKAEKILSKLNPALTKIIQDQKENLLPIEQAKYSIGSLLVQKTIDQYQKIGESCSADFVLDNQYTEDQVAVQLTFKKLPNVKVLEEIKTQLLKAYQTH